MFSRTDCNRSGCVWRVLRAFSILELIVAMALFAMVAIVAVSIVDGAMHMTKSSKLRMSADAASREAFDRMAADFSTQLQRKDLPDVVEKRTGNDRIFFHAQVDGASGDRGLSVVNYLVSDYPALADPDKNFGDRVLLRGVSGTDWSGTESLVFDATNAAMAVDQGTLEVAAPEVFRLEVVFLMADGSLLASPPTPSVGTNANLLRSTNGVPSSQQVVAAIVGIASLDSKARLLLPPNGMETLVELLPDGVSGTDDLLAQWKGALDGSDLPRPILNGVRFYQRYFSLH